MLLQAQQHSAEALDIKRQADPLVDFCGHLLAHRDTPGYGLYMGNADITPTCRLWRCSVTKSHQPEGGWQGAA